MDHDPTRTPAEDSHDDADDEDRSLADDASEDGDVGLPPEGDDPMDGVAPSG